MTVPPGEQSFCLAASYLEERSRSWEIGAGGQALRSKPLVPCGMATRATVPICHVELPFGYTRQYSLQLFEALHVHGSLHRPPPFVSRNDRTRLGANCNHPARLACPDRAAPMPNKPRRVMSLNRMKPSCRRRLNFAENLPRQRAPSQRSGPRKRDRARARSGPGTRAVRGAPVGRSLARG